MNTLDDVMKREVKIGMVPLPWEAGVIVNQIPQLMARGLLHAMGKERILLTYDFS